MAPKPSIDPPGLVYGNLRTLRLAPRTCGHTNWVCQCVCGKIHVAKQHHLRSGLTRSCGCLRRSINRTLHTTHGRAGTPLYRVWRGMINRCHYPKAENYARYGGRGITVCARWRHDFATFAADMGPRPTPKHTIDRKDNTLGYSPENCRWATYKEQRANQR